MVQLRSRTAADPMLLAAAIVIAFVGVSTCASAQSSNLTAPGRVEGAGPTMSIGTAATGTVSEVLVREGSRVGAGQPLVRLDCKPTEAQVHGREAQLAAAQAAFDRARDGSRPDEIAVGEAVVGYSKARADEADKALDRAEAMHEGVTITVAHMLEVQRDARIANAQLAEAGAKLSLLRAGSREEDVREAQSKRDAAAADLEMTKAQLDQCTIRAPVDGVVLDIAVNQGQYLSLSVPQPLLHMVQNDPLRVRAEIEPRDLARICALQRATVAADGFPNTPIHAQVETISPMVGARSIAAPGAEVHGNDIVAVTLNLERGGPALPIGLPVTVRFDACPSKT